MLRRPPRPGGWRGFFRMVAGHGEMAWIGRRIRTRGGAPWRMTVTGVNAVAAASLAGDGSLSLLTRGRPRA
jgi:hypothetical protein